MIAPASAAPSTLPEHALPVVPAPRRHVRRLTAVGLVGVLACVALGCTSGGDGADDAVAADDGGEAAAVVTRAVEQARNGTGRFVLTYRDATDDDGEDDGATSREFRGDVAGESVAWTTGWVDEPEQDATARRVDGRTYLGTDALRTRIQMQAEGMVAVTEGEEFQGYRPSDAAAEWDTAVLDGKDWVDVTDLPGGLTLDDGIDPVVMTFLIGTEPVDPIAFAELVTGVTEQGPEDLDGVRARHFTGTAAMGALVEVLSGGERADGVDPAQDGERAARQAAIDRYLEDHTTIAADVYLDERDQLSRVEIHARNEVEEEYRDCWAMFVPFDELTITADFRDMGGDITIEAPDPSTVLSLPALAAAFPGTWTSDESEPDPDTDDVVETVDGPRRRDAVVNDLSKFGYVIGLVPDPWVADPDRAETRGPHVRAEGVAALSDEELAARFAEVDALLAAMPRTPTSLGEMTRPELLWNVKVGMQYLDIDLAVADGLSDAQLGELIDGYVADNGWIVGDGVWGDMDPALIEQFQSQDDAGSDGAGSSVESEYAGCPS